MYWKTTCLKSTSVYTNLTRLSESLDGDKKWHRSPPHEESICAVESDVEVMSLRCLLGHEMGPPVIEESEESDMTIRKQTRTCLRCGKTTVEYENTRVSINEIEQDASTASQQLETDSEAAENTETVKHEDRPESVDTSPPEPPQHTPDPTNNQIETPEPPDYTTGDLPDDETYSGEGDALLIDDSTDSPEDDPSSPEIGVMENAYGEGYTADKSTQEPDDFNHGAFKGGVSDEAESSSDSGEILTDEPEPEVNSDADETSEYEKNHVLDQSILLTCNNCAFTDQQAGSPLRAGDICGKCGSGYLQQSQHE
jgi:hypothetical protein